MINPFMNLFISMVNDIGEAVELAKITGDKCEVRVDSGTLDDIKSDALKVQMNHKPLASSILKIVEEFIRFGTINGVYLQKAKLPNTKPVEILIVEKGNY